MRILTALVLAAPAAAQLQDVGFDEVTPLPDVDLVVVREKAVGAGGIDLSAYGMPGIHDYVQSLYVRARHGSTTAVRILRGRLVFPAGITVLGVITDGADLGGSLDDGVLTETDLIFGVAPADDYSANGRGLTNSQHDHAAKRPNGTVDYHFKLNNNDLDDFRVIIDYGTAFPPDLAFDVELLTHPGVQAVIGEPGLRIGDAGGVVLGSGDWGEELGLTGIPLTAGVLPLPNAGLTWDMTAGIMIHRNGGLSSGSIDLYDPVQQFLGSDLMRAGYAKLSRGPYGYVYAADLNFAGYVVSDIVGGGHGRVPVAGIMAPQVIGAIEGSKEVVLARHQASLSSPVDVTRVDVDSGLPIITHTTIAGDLIGLKGCTVASGQICILGNPSDLLIMDPVTGGYAHVALTPAAGAYVAIETNAIQTELYLLRSLPFGAGTVVDVVDLASGAITYEALKTNTIKLPEGITRDAAGNVWIVERGWAGGVSYSLSAWDPSTWTLILGIEDYGANSASGSIRADVNPSTFGTRGCAPAVPNSTGYPGWVSAVGSLAVADNGLYLAAFDLPTKQSAYFINSVDLGFVPNPGGSDGNLCLGGTIGRHVDQVQNSGNAGSIRILVDLTDMPNGSVTVLPGETWHFQCWYRDVQGSSNFTDRLSLTFL